MFKTIFVLKKIPIKKERKPVNLEIGIIIIVIVVDIT